MVAILLVTGSSARAGSLTGSFASILQGADVNLTVEGPIDWVHWGLYTESSLDRKAGVSPLISDFTVLYATNDYAYVYQFADNYNGYSWSDGTPTASVTSTPTGVWAYGVPTRGSGFQFTVPADTTLRTLKVYVGAFAARGDFEASLSDNSASAYSNTSLVNMGNGPSGVYSISYAAQSAGQTLTIKWTLAMGTRADANVTLQAAALDAPGANNPPAVAITSPSDNANFSAGSNIVISADAFDIDGTITKVEFFQGDTKLGESTSNPYSLTWSNAPPGNYLLTARAADNGGATRTSAPVEVFVNGTGGTLLGSGAFPATSVDQTAEGVSDWAHWGLISPASFDHKAGVPQQISNFVRIGTNDTQRLEDNFTAFAWSDGIPTADTNGTRTGVFTYGMTNGFLLSVPADTNSRTLKVYVSLYGAEGKFQAYLSDYSAPAYTDTALRGLTVYDNAYTNYTLEYRAASSGQLLIVKFTARTVFDADYGNVSLEAATLSSLPTNAPPTVSITSPTNSATFAAPANIRIQADASDADGTISKVEFYSGTTLLGAASTFPYEFNWSSVPAGNYYLTAKATDNQGATTTSRAVSISVVSPTNAPPTVDITSPTNNTVFIAPAAFAIQATASDSDGTVTQVEFFNGTTSLGIDTTSPYTAAANNLAAGSYTLSAVATDDRGATATNSVILIVDAPPTVSIINPTNNATFTAPASITLLASASDADGTVSKVEFYSGTALLGTLTSSPYTFNWGGVPAGNYTVTAIATDNLGGTATSTAVNITVTNGTATAVTIINPRWNGNGFSFSFATASGYTYPVEYKDSLNLISWQSLTNFVGNGTIINVTNIATTIERFYRVGVQ